METVRQSLRNELEIHVVQAVYMINVPFTYTLEMRRRKAGLTQQQAADLTQISRQRWNAIERGRYRPTHDEICRMESLLGILQGPLKPARALQTLLCCGRRSAPTPLPYFPNQDRPSFIRFHAAGQRCPQLVARLASTVSARPDFALCDFLCDRIAFDSYAEVLFVLHLLADGAEPSLVAPTWLGMPTPRPIVEPDLKLPVGHRPSPCLIKGKDFYFFQVSFETPRLYTVDALQWNEKRGWTVVEIDGGGHDFQFDAVREAAIGLPVRRIPAVKVEQANFLAA